MVSNARPTADTPRFAHRPLVQTPLIACVHVALGVTVAPGQARSARGSFCVMVRGTAARHDRSFAGGRVGEFATIGRSCRAEESRGALKAFELFAQLVVPAVNSKFDCSFGRAKHAGCFLN